MAVNSGEEYLLNIRGICYDVRIFNNIWSRLPAFSVSQRRNGLARLRFHCEPRGCEKRFEDKVSSDGNYVRSMQVLVARARLVLY